MKTKLPRVLHPLFIDDTLMRAPKGATTLNALYAIPLQGGDVQVVADWNYIIRQCDRAS